MSTDGESTDPAVRSNSSNMFVEAWSGVRKPVFVPASLIIIGLVAFAAIYGSKGGGDAFANLNELIVEGVGWWYVLLATGLVFFAAFCALTRIGNIRLGRDDERPEFGVFSWFAMLFSAGMGIGLVFYGAAEPLSHYVNPPEAGGIAGSTDAAANQAMGLTIFHWGLHAWAIYVVVGLGLAYMTYRKGRPLSVRWLLEPLLGRTRIEGWIGHTIDTVAVIGTLFGVATSLGFGVQQIMAGLEYLGWVERSPLLIVVLITVITGIATYSVLSGVNKGLKWLSNINMAMAASLAAFVLLLGPTLYLLQSWVQNLGGYVQAFPELMLRTAPFADDGWAGAWTIFYWGWWISWAPFVGMFIARISRGRTIREFIAGVMLAPTAVATMWFTIFGDTAILRQRNDGDLLVDGTVNTDTSLFQVLEGLPLGVITSVLAIFVVVFFFITSSDSGSLVIDILSSGGDLETGKLTRIYWAIMEGIAAAVLLLVGGSASLTALQTISIATAVPFSIVLALACVSLFKAFRYEVKSMPQYVRVQRPEIPDVDTDTGAPTHRAARDISATLAGLGQPAPRRPGRTDHEVFAIHVVSRGSLKKDPATGTWDVAEEAQKSDPLGGEVFDTPEFEESAEGQARGDGDTIAPE